MECLKEIPVPDYELVKSGFYRYSKEALKSITDRAAGIVTFQTYGNNAESYLAQKKPEQ